MNRLVKISLALVLLLSQTGCWDQKTLKETIFASATSFEKGKKGKIITNVAVQSYTTKEIQSVNKTYKATASSPREARIHLNEQLSSQLMSAKNRVYLIENKLAEEEGILPLLDVMYRTPESPLNGKYVIVDGSPSEILNLEQVGQELIGGYLAGLIETAEANSEVPEETVQSICTILFDKGKGLVLPYVKLNQTNKTASVIGSALFHHDKFSGVTLDEIETKLLLVLGNKKQKYMQIADNIKIDGKKETMSYEVNNTEADLKIHQNKMGHITVNVPLKMGIDILEFPHNQLEYRSEILLLEKRLSKMLTKRADKVMKKTQKANSDFLGIGRELEAYHPKIWKTVNWEKDYKKITIKPQIKVTIDYKGIIN